MKLSLLNYSFISFIIMNIIISLKRLLKDKSMMIMDKDLKEYKEKVREERKQIVLISGITSSIIVSLLKYVMKIKMNMIKTFGLLFLIQEMIYRLLPKKNWMVVELEEKEDRKKWVRKYKCFSDISVYSDIIALVLILIN